MKLIAAIKKDEALISEMDNLMSDETNFYVWWLGQSGFLLQWKGKRVLIDPYLSDSLTEKYAATDKPHTRMSELVVQPDLLKKISVVSSSHNHTDHLDAITLNKVLETNPGISFIIPEANRDFVAAKLGCDRTFPIGLNDKDSVTIDGFTFHGIPAKHNEIARDELGRCKYMGYVISFGEHSIYHSGDTIWFDELPGLLLPFNIQLALLPINGNDISRKVAGNLDAAEAVALAKAINAACVVPCHYDMFSFNTADVNDFIKIAEQEGQQYNVLTGGGLFKSR